MIGALWLWITCPFIHTLLTGFPQGNKQRGKLLACERYGGKKLSYADSNHDKQNQNLLCYHYTIRQSIVQIGLVAHRAVPVSDLRVQCSEASRMKQIGLVARRAVPVSDLRVQSYKN